MKEFFSNYDFLGESKIKFLCAEIYSIENSIEQHFRIY